MRRTYSSFDIVRVKRGEKGYPLCIKVFQDLWSGKPVVFKRAQRPLTMGLHMPWASLLLAANQNQMWNISGYLVLTQRS